jgi:hypothetical protein
MSLPRRHEPLRVLVLQHDRYGGLGAYERVLAQRKAEAESRLTPPSSARWQRPFSRAGSRSQKGVARAWPPKQVCGGYVAGRSLGPSTRRTYLATRGARLKLRESEEPTTYCVGPPWLLGRRGRTGRQRSARHCRKAQRLDW